ncbi:MAG: CDP-alcohol phosphatidyltransferase family protein [Opitutaceae bacterium]
MPTIYDIKPKFQALLRPICQRLAAKGVTANQVTVVAMLLSFATGGLLTWRPNNTAILLIVPVVLFVRMALNAIDGMLAREHGQKSPLGAILNEVSDVLSDAALYLPFAFVGGIHSWLVIWIVVLAIVSEMTGVVAVQIGASRRYDGPLGKSDRAFLFGLIALLAGCGVPLHPWINPGLALAAVLLAVTIVNRARHALAEVARRTPRA